MGEVELYGLLQTPPFGFPPGLTGGYQRITLYGEEEILLTSSVRDLSDPTTIKSAFTQTFTVPGNSFNSYFFQNVFEINADSFDSTKKVPAYINVDGLFFMSGYFNLDEIIQDRNSRSHEFKINFFGTTSSFGSQIAGKYLANLNFANSSVNYIFSNIVSSWGTTAGATGGILNGDIIFPLVEWGYDYDSTGVPQQSTLAVYNATTAPKGFTNPINPLNIGQFQPFTRLKLIWDEIFQEAGFTYTSTFLNSARFKKIYYNSTALKQASLNTSNQFLNVNFGSSQNINLATSPTGVIYAPALFPPNVDIYNGYDTSNGIWTQPFSWPTVSNITVEANILGFYTSSSTVATSCRLRRNRAGVITDFGAIFPPALPISLSVSSFTVNFTHTISNIEWQNGDQFYIWFGYASGAFTNLAFGGSNLIFTTTPTINPTIMFPPDKLTQADFIKSVTKKFNLVFDPDPVVPNNFLIEPWVDWIKLGKSYSWSKVLDESSPVTTSFLFNDMPKTYITKDANDTDYLNRLFELQKKRVIGTQNYLSPIEIIEGEKIDDSGFSPVPLSPIAGSNTNLIPHFAVDTPEKREPMQVSPRLVFWNGLYPFNAGTTGYVDTGSGIQPINVIPRVSSFETFNTASGTGGLVENGTFNLHYGNEEPYWNYSIGNIWNPTSSAIVTGYTSNNTFTEYWQKWFNAYYNKNSKILTAKFNLSFVDIKNLRFNDRIWIKDSWWFPIEFRNYPVGQTQNVQVTLVKYGTELGINFGTNSALYSQELCYGETQCEACCCDTGDIQVYTDRDTLSTSNTIWLDEFGFIPASSGWYLDPTTGEVYFVNNNGQIIRDDTFGSPYGCTPCECPEPPSP